ncbi:MAG: hypothetical protein JWO53_1005 [Chlamydiia bacterium]|nr:hypothetical protein [Chlamydiia bacterium]
MEGEVSVKSIRWRYFTFVIFVMAPLFQCLTAGESPPQATKKKIYIYAEQCVSDMFAIQNTAFNRDNCLEPMYRLREEASKQNYNIQQTSTLQGLQDFEYLVVFEIPGSGVAELSQYPKEKLILFLWEPPSVLSENYNPKNHEIFSKVYTWNDALIDNQKYFKFYYPVLNSMVCDSLPFEKKKLATVISCNKSSSHVSELYSERRKVIDFFENHHSEDFDLYGRWWPSSCKVYKGVIERKVDCLKQYRFCFAYENIKEIPGYVTEKLFDCFQAGCVPVYLGASNISKYVPQECFIAREQFENDASLYEFLVTMPEVQYQEYIKNIQKFLESEQAKLFSIEMFIKIFMSIKETSSKKYGMDKRVDTIAFSFDRPLQLYAYLESTEKYLRGVGVTHVIYRATNEDYERAYLEVAHRFPTTIFHKQSIEPHNNFKELVLSSLYSKDSPSSYMLFAVDDLIVKDYVDLEVCTQALEEQQAWGFFLRLGKNINYCYMIDKSTPLPKGVDLEKNMFCRQFFQGDGDWGYPNTTDMTVYRKNDLTQFLQNEEFINPNSLELSWQKWIKMDGKGLCFQTSKNINIPLNVVNLSWCNRHNHSFTPQELLEKFGQGKKMDITAFHQIENISPHIDLMPTFVDR